MIVSLIFSFMITIIYAGSAQAAESGSDIQTRMYLKELSSLAAWQCKNDIKSAEEYLNDLKFSHDSNRLAILRSYKVEIWDVNSNSKIKSFDMGRGEYYSYVAWVAGENKIMLAGGKTCKELDIQTGLSNHIPVNLYIAALSPDGKKVAAVNFKLDDAVTVTTSGTTCTIYQNKHQNGVVAIVNLPDKKILQMINGDRLPGANEPGIISAVFSGDGETFALANKDNITLLNIATGEKRKINTATDTILQLSMHAKFLAVKPFNDTPMVLDLSNNNKEINIITMHPDEKEHWGYSLFSANENLHYWFSGVSGDVWITDIASKKSMKFAISKNVSRVDCAGNNSLFAAQEYCADIKVYHNVGAEIEKFYQNTADSDNKAFLAFVAEKFKEGWTQGNFQNCFDEERGPWLKLSQSSSAVEALLKNISTRFRKTVKITTGDFFH